MTPRLTHPRRALAALLSIAALCGLTVVGTALARTVNTTTATTPASTTTTSATTTTTPAAKPKLTLSWTVLIRRCSRATKTVKVKTKKGTKRVRECGQRPSRAHGRVLHLRWRQHGEVFGRLTLAGQPIADAIITIQSTITRWKSTSTNVVTNAHGGFTATITGPDRTITLAYSPGPGTEVVATKKVQAVAHLSLKIRDLRAGHNARFTGIVFGGHIPQDLYIQFWYYTGPAGWQPFSHLAIVKRHNGHWSTEVPIPAGARGYRYEIKATVVPSPNWPWAQTDSTVVTRIVT